VYDSIKSGRVVVVLAGRFAGRKAVVVKAYDDGSDDKKFGHALGEYLILMMVYYEGAQNRSKLIGSQV
jgi:ribosomal protein L24